MKKQFVFTVLCFYLGIIHNNVAFASSHEDQLKGTVQPTYSYFLEYSDVYHNPERIYHKVDHNLCAEWEITKNLQIKYDYERAKEIKEDGVFYYYDDENEMIQTQNFLSDGQVIIKTLFWYQGISHIISLICCKKNLVENKKVLKTLHQKIINGQL